MSINDALLVVPFYAEERGCLLQDNSYAHPPAAECYERWHAEDLEPHHSGDQGKKRIAPD